MVVSPGSCHRVIDPSGLGDAGVYTRRSRLLNLPRLGTRSNHLLPCECDRLCDTRLQQTQSPLRARDLQSGFYP
ncbi:MAG: hypothetical protein JJU32_10610 [Phormidium sp. BM_Day4_Bin.17]|nr:hypothetical protein [Phormidium sp. BM_Day4_Bin.17]UCJ12075.1 MAG: hypothetical protein JWS08_20615 [Phormidium sp. PBR-2020]